MNGCAAIGQFRLDRFAILRELQSQPDYRCAVQDANNEFMSSESKPLRVMVVEDSEAFLLRLRVALSSSRLFKVVGWAETASAAIRLLEQTQPDLILLDLCLKEGSGVEVLRHIHKSGTKVRTLVMTGDRCGELQSACLSLGAHRFLDKAELLTAVMEEADILARELAY